MVRDPIIDAVERLESGGTARVTYAGADHFPLLRNAGGLSIANLSLVVLFVGSYAVLLPRQIELIDPVHKIANFGYISALASVLALFGSPIAGALSDRTRSRFGRRTPWILAGGVLSLGLMAILGAIHQVLMVGIMWGCIQVTANLSQAALMGAVPERIAPHHRGIAGSLLGLGIPIGSLIGVQIASLYINSLATGYIVLGACLLLGMIVSVILSPDRSSLELPITKQAPVDWIAGFGRAFGSRDFTWTFINRAGIILCYSLTTQFQLYYLADYIRLPLGVTPASAIAILTPFLTISMIAGSFLAGWASDRMGQRKPFIVGSALIMSLALVIPLVSPVLASMYVFSLLFGAGFGCYMSVAIALSTEVLPSADDSGRDIGIIGLANTATQMVAPLVASILILHAGGYGGLFLTAAVCAALSSLTILRVKGVR